MTRKIWSAALALSLAGGVYMAQTANASNMGFKLERDFDYKRTSAAGTRPLLNVYYVSLPLFNGLGDVADSTAINPVGGQPFKNKCVGDANGPPGPAGDGEINSDDMICDWWVERANISRAGAFQVLSIDVPNCGTFTRSASIVFGRPEFAPGNPFPPAGTDLWTNRGYQVNIDTSGPGNDPHNRAVIVGSHDPGFSGQILHYSLTCGTNAGRADIISVPYHTMYQRSIEILCGLRGLAWQDGNNDWRPDDTSPAGCAGGIFDGAHGISVITAKNDDPALGGRSGFQAQSVSFGGLPPSVQVSPPDPFDLIPGEAYRVPMLLGHVDTTFVSPHF